MARHRFLIVATVLVAACQSAGSPTTAPTQVAAPTSSPVAATAVPTASPAATKPLTLPRTVDVPLDGTCEDNGTASCLGKLTAGKAYTTKVFTPAMTFTMPTSDWVNPGENGGGVALFSTHDIGDVIIVFRDAKSIDRTATTVTDIASWLASNDNLTVTSPVKATVGGLSGVTMDIRVAPGATSTDPGCPIQVCVSMLRGDDPVPNDPYQWHWDWSAAGMEVQRLYLLDGPDTVIAIFVDSIDGLTFDAMTQTFDAMKASIAFH